MKHLLLQFFKGVEVKFMRGKNELLRFFGGLAMMAVGLFLLFNRVHVGSAGFGWGRLSFGFFSMPSGLVVVPLIIGVVWMFATDGSFVSKIFTVISVLFIIAAIIMNTSFWVDRMTMFDWLLMLIMIFAGGTMVATVLFQDHLNVKNKEQNDAVEAYKKMADAETKRADELEKELKAVKDSLKDKNSGQA